MRVRKLTFALLLSLFIAAPGALAKHKLQGYCEQGGQSAVTSGLSSTTKVQVSYPNCTVSIYDAGTANLSIIYGDDAGTPKANPFVAAADGEWWFYADNGRYDVRFSGGTIAAPFTRGDWIAYDPAIVQLQLTYVVVPYADPMTFNAGAGSIFATTLTGNVGTLTVTNPGLGRVIYTSVCQDGVGSHTFAWPANFVDAPTIDAKASACTVASFLYDGSKWRNTAGVAFPLSAEKGGTGLISPLDNAVLIGAGASPIKTAAGVANQVLRVPGGGGTPAFGALDLAQAAAIANQLPVANGGTGAANAAGARANLGAAASGVNGDITQITSLSTPLSVPQGGTGAANAAGARSNLGAAASGANSDITSLSSLATPLSVAQGGTGAATAANARTNLGITNGPVLVAADYDFTPQAPGGLLTATTPATITLSPVPAGVNGTDVTHRLYISGGTGTAETVLITGGTAVAGAASGTITFTPANHHSGAWTISSATGGVAEAQQDIVSNKSGKGEIYISRPATFYGVLTGLANTRITFSGPQREAMVVVRGAGYTAGDLFRAALGTTVWTFRNMGISQTLGVAQTGAAIECIGAQCEIDFVYILDGQYGVIFSGVATSSITNFAYLQIDMSFKALAGIKITGLSVNVYIANVYSNGAPVTDPNILDAGVLIDNADGVWMQSVLAGGNSGFVISPTAPDYTVNITCSGCIVDGPATYGVYVAGTGVISGIRLVGGHFHGQSACAGPVIAIAYGSAVNINNLEITGGIVAGGDNEGIYIGVNAGSNIKVHGVSVVDNNRGNHANSAAVYLATNAQGVEISDNTILNQGTGHQKWGIAALTNLTDAIITGNDLSTAETGAMSLSGTLTRILVANNKGLDDVVGTVASAGTVALPHNSTITITGTTGITAITGLWEGRKVNLITPDGTVTFSAGATIGNTITSTQNVPMVGIVSGGKLYLK